MKFYTEFTGDDNDFNSFKIFQVFWFEIFQFQNMHFHNLLTKSSMPEALFAPVSLPGKSRSIKTHAKFLFTHKK